jgi:hypothetical protein
VSICGELGNELHHMNLLWWRSSLPGPGLAVFGDGLKWRDAEKARLCRGTIYDMILA